MFVFNNIIYQVVLESKHMSIILLRREDINKLKASD